MHRRSSLAPVRLFNTALSEKPARLLLGEAQAVGAAAVKQVGVFGRREDSEEALYASGLRIVGRQPAAEAQRGQANLDGVRKAGGRLRPRAASAEKAQRG